MYGSIAACMVAVLVMMALFGSVPHRDASPSGPRVAEPPLRVELREDRQAREGDAGAFLAGGRAIIAARDDEAFAQRATVVLGALRRSVAMSDANTQRVRTMLDGARTLANASPDDWARRRIAFGLAVASGSTSMTMSQLEAARDETARRVETLRRATDERLASCESHDAGGDLADTAGCDEMRSAARDFGDASDELSDAYDDAVQAARNNAAAQAEMIEAARG